MPLTSTPKNETRSKQNNKSRIIFSFDSFQSLFHHHFTLFRFIVPSLLYITFNHFSIVVLHCFLSLLLCFLTSFFHHRFTMFSPIASGLFIIFFHHCLMIFSIKVICLKIYFCKVTFQLRKIRRLKSCQT